ncbi:MAG TPA: rhomboid family intramembrane serine protease [Ktedonobacterales bacterium]|nr:rhomboid family intramembrane serine protease [Ktedonobacterales bacterium]
MEQQTDIQTRLTRGDTLLKEGDLRGAAEEFANAARAEPNNPGGHLGLAEASLALGDFATTQQASAEVLRLAPESAEGSLARAILAALAQRFDLALHEVDHSIELDPTRGYAHALRAYTLRRLGQRYEGALAEARAGRTWGTRDLDHLFAAVPKPAAPAPTVAAGTDLAPQIPTRPGPTPWQQRSARERQMVRARFMFNGIPIVTYTLMAINIVIYVFTAMSGNLLYNLGAAQGYLIEHDPIQAYRIITSMFLHGSLIHIGANMLSLFFVGIIVERVFGSGRFTVIYFASGIIAGIAQAVISPAIPSVGASGAIAGIFGAFGAYILLRRQSLGPAANSLIGQWVFWLAINAYISISSPNIALWAHVGGLVSGFIIGAIMASMQGRRRTRAG